MALGSVWLVPTVEKSLLEEELKEERNYLYLLKTDISINDFYSLKY